MERRLEPELLDHLPPDDPRAQRERRDLQMVNRLMRHAEFITEHIASSGLLTKGGRIVELGAGDGTLTLNVAHRLALRGKGRQIVLVDKHGLVSRQTREGFQALGWEVKSVTADVFDWLRSDAANTHDVIVANLFLHHFDEPRLRELLQHVEQQTRLFVTCEPQRTWLPFTLSHFLQLIGCSSVTRRDATTSVRAGFRGRELSALWPNAGQWELSERGAGLFSQVFVAARKA